MKFHSFVLIVFGLLAIASCHKHDDENDTQAPALTIEEPTEGQSISGEVHFHGKTTDKSLHEMEIKVTRDADGSEIFKSTPTVHDKTEYDFDEHFTPSGLTAEIPVTLVIKVEDHNENITTKTVKFKIKP